MSTTRELHSVCGFFLGMGVVIIITAGDSEVNVMEDIVLVGDNGPGGGCVVLLLDVNVRGWVLNNERHLLGDRVLLDFVDGELADDGLFVWDLDLCGVMLPEFNDVWLIDGDSEWDLLPLSHWEPLLNVVWLLLVFGDGDLFAGDEGHLLDDGVVHSLGNFVG